jgi:hypothetical protein
LGSCCLGLWVLRTQTVGPPISANYLVQPCFVLCIVCDSNVCQHSIHVCGPIRLLPSGCPSTNPCLTVATANSIATLKAKGLWAYLPGAPTPAVSFIGSPNFGARSSERDLECQVAVLTDDLSLREAFHCERGGLYRRGEAVTASTFERPDRQVKWWEFLMGSALAGFF